jgi:hypothetical protein
VGSPPAGTNGGCFKALAELCLTSRLSARKRKVQQGKPVLVARQRSMTQAPRYGNKP